MSRYTFVCSTVCTGAMKKDYCYVYIIRYIDSADVNNDFGYTTKY